MDKRTTKKLKQVSPSWINSMTNNHANAWKKLGKVSDKLKKRYMELKSGSKEMNKKLLDFFEEGKDKFKKEYDENKLLNKIGKVAKKAGAKMVYIILVLYYSLLGKDVSLKDKAMILAALGYFITPVDFIPDFFGLIGFGDDFAVILYVFKKIRGNVTPDVRRKAKEKIMELFGEDHVSFIHRW